MNIILPEHEHVDRIDAIKKQALYICFINFHCEDISLRKNKTEIDAAIVRMKQQFPQLEALIDSQIMRQWHNYCSNVLMRKQIGSRFYDLTVTFLQAGNFFVENSVIPILFAVYDVFRLLAKLWVLPVKLRTFLHQCMVLWTDRHNHNDNEQNNVNFNQIDLIQDDNMKAILFDIAQYMKQYFLLNYLQCWEEFKTIEAQNVDSTYTSPDLIISGLEFAMIQRRNAWVKEDHPVFNAFWNNTYIGDCIHGINGDGLYNYITGEWRQKAPLFVQMALENNNLVPFQLLLFQLVENETWRYYKRNLSFLGVYLFDSNNVKQFDSNLGDDFQFTHRETDISHANETNNTNTTMSIDITSLKDLTLQIIYYISGFCLKKSIQTLNRTDSESLEYKSYHTLLNKLTLPLHSDECNLLPCGLIKERQRVSGKLICPTREIFHLMCGIEVNFIDPFVRNYTLLACSGSTFYATVFNALKASVYFDLFAQILHECLRSEFDSVILSEIELKSFVRKVSDKFFDVFCHVVVADAVKCINAKLNMSHNSLNKLSFRMKVFLDKIKKGDFELDM
jgi:hypothetical protein